MRSAHRLVCNNIKLLPSEEGTFKVLRHFTWKPRPKSGLDCLVLTVLFRGGGDNVNDFQDFRAENGSRQGQNLALAGLCVPYSLDSGHRK